MHNFTMRNTQLSPRQARFVSQLAILGNGAAAARAAGYAPKAARITASKLLAKGNVQAALQAEEAVVAAQMGVTRQRVLDGLLEAVGTARERGEPMAMVSAWREVARVCGFYAPERVRIGVEHGDDDAVATGRRLNLLSDAELVRLIEAGRTPAETDA